MKSSPARRAPAVLVVTAALGLFSGCSSPSATGTVKFNGIPVEDGSITFSSGEKGSKEEKKAGAKIVDGNFTIPSSAGLTAGKNRVEILWNKKTGKKVGTPGDSGTTIDETVQVIPAQYNTATTLEEEVKSGSNTFTFDLKGTDNVPGKTNHPGDPNTDRRIKD